MHVLMFLTILSMSDCLGMCLRIIDKGVSVGTSAWGVCVCVMHQQDRLLLSQLHLTFPSSLDRVRNQNRLKRPCPSELNNQTPPTKSDRAQFGA